MPQIVSNIKNVEFWRLDENSSLLYQMIADNLSQAEKQKYETFKNERRRCEWLATRILLRQMLGRCSQIIYNENGKPFIENSNLNISITHADKMVAVYISDLDNAGIDMERLSPRILKIKDKFLHKSELDKIPESVFIDNLYVHWCAKEAMYKAFNIENYDYKNSYALENFDVLTKDETFKHYTGRVSIPNRQCHYFDVQCHRIEKEHIFCEALLRKKLTIDN